MDQSVFGELWIRVISLLWFCFCALFTGQVNTVLVYAGVCFFGPGAALNAAAQLRSKYESLVYMGDFCRLNLQYL